MNPTVRRGNSHRPTRRRLAPHGIGNWAWGVIIVCLAMALNCRRDGTEDQPAPQKDDSWFTEATSDAGITFVHTSGDDGSYLFPETVTSGACLFDYDNDGWLDLYVVQGGHLKTKPGIKPTNIFYRNRGDGTFEDVTASSRTGDTGYGMGCTYGDYDNDGDADLYVTNFGPNVLYRNNGDGTFSNVSAEAGVGDTKWGSSCAFADYDGDGHLDLFVVNYLYWTVDRETVCMSQSNVRTHCAPTNYDAPAPDTLFHNNGDGTFTDVTASAGLARTLGNGLGIVCGDFDRDGRLDFYVTNDGGPNRLWINKGGGRFEDGALLAGCALNINGVAEAGMGVVAFDLEPDGDLDLFMVHIRNETNTFYLNHGGWFEDTTSTTGLAASSIGFTGFGLSMSDFDNDGRRDVFIADGGVAMGGRQFSPDDPYAQPNLLFRGLAGGKFELVKPLGGTNPTLIETSRGAAGGDIDNDGDIDVVVVNKDAPLHLLRNHIGKRGSWIMFRVLNKHGSDALGAEMRITVGGTEQHRILFPSY
ncbi:MAG: VCBS repeat-containing protein, partial [Planctomycetes bacterium]|nr:VCBS repeat-containing protein [Planctomycetota bacterium]